MVERTGFIDNTPSWWNLDIFLAQLIATNLRDYVHKHAGHPAEMTEEAWNAKLTSIADRLEAYSKKFDAETLAGEMEITAKGQAALRELAEIFPSLWD